MLIATLSSEETIPPKFLEGILLDLKGRGVLGSKGKTWRLSTEPSDVLDKTTLADLLTQVEAAKQEHSRQPLNVSHLRLN